jgi:hypothetical protein
MYSAHCLQKVTYVIQGYAVLTGRTSDSRNTKNKIYAFRCSNTCGRLVAVRVLVDPLVRYPFTVVGYRAKRFGTLTLEPNGRNSPHKG